jgi:hypothetical protein
MNKKNSIVIILVTIMLFYKITLSIQYKRTVLNIIMLNVHVCNNIQYSFLSLSDNCQNYTDLNTRNHNFEIIIIMKSITYIITKSQHDDQNTIN